MKIIIYQPRCSYYVGGGEVIPLQQAEYFAKNGHEVTLVTTKCKAVKMSDFFLNFLARNTGVKVLYLEVNPVLEYIYSEPPGSSWYRWNNESLHLARQVIPIIHTLDGDIFVAHNIVDSLALPVGANTIVHLHGYPEELNYMYELCLSYPHKYVAVSGLVKNKWNQILDLKAVSVVFNGVDVKTFFPRENKSGR